MLLKLRKPVMVPDLNYLQSLPIGREYLSSKSFWLWPFTIFTEASARGERSEGYIHKLMRIYRQNHKRCAIAKELSSICSLDYTCIEDLDWDSVVDYDLTQAIGAASELDSPTRILSHLDKINAQRDSDHNDFWSIMSLCKDQERDIDASFFFQDINRDRETINSNNAKTFFLKLSSELGNDDAADSFFRDYHKNSSPLLSFARLLLYIGLRWKAKPLTKNELNDFDDLTYAVIASITGHIVTSDKAIIRMLNVCSPEVNIHNYKVSA